MSLLDDFTRRDVTDFPGLDDVSAAEENDRAVLVRNVSWERHYVQTRPGVELYDTIEAGDPTPGGVNVVGFYAMHYWPTADWDRILFLAKAASSSFVTHLNLDLGTREDMLTGLAATVTGLVPQESGTRIFYALVKDDGKAATAGKVTNGLFTGSVGSETDDLFQAPFTNVTMTETTPSSGVMTAGDHAVALVYKTRNGYVTKAHDLDDVATAVDGSNLVITITPGANWPAWIDQVQLLLAPVSNPAQFYFVDSTRGGTASPTIGTTTPIQFTLNFSDQELSALTDATDQFTLATSADIGNPKFVDAYGDRMVYLADRVDSGSLGNVTSIIFSERSRPQTAWLFRNERFLPGKLEATAGFQLYGAYYVLGPNWTYAFQDTTGYPVEWQTADVISNSVGVLYPGCVSRQASNADAVQTRFVAATQGMFAFTGGSYSQLPMSYWQTTTWNRINWSAPAWCFKVVDDHGNQRVHFLCPLDAATTPSHVLTWDYKKGFGRNSVRFSLDDYAHGNIASMTMVKRPSTNRRELWMAERDGQDVWRTMNATDDASPYNDAGSGIDSVYRSQKLADVEAGQQRIMATHVTLEGSGQASLRLYDYNQKARRGPLYRTLTTAAKHILKIWRLNSETAYLEVSNQKVADQWWRLSWLRSYYQKWLSQ